MYLQMILTKFLNKMIDWMINLIKQFFLVP